MSLLVTSCTMGKQPDRLLNKGPQYLRTRTNAGMFGQNRKSAVELLAASKAQFYNIGASVSLDNHQDLAVSFGQHERYGRIYPSGKLREPARCKSQYDLSVAHLTTTDRNIDENNDGSSDDSVSLSQLDAFNSKNRSNPQDNVELQESISLKGTTASVSTPDFVKNIGDASDSNPAFGFSEKIAVGGFTPQPKLTVLRSASETLHETEPVYENITFVSKAAVNSDEVDGNSVNRPVPLPRKSKEKPIPPPRKFSARTPLPDKERDLHVGLSRAVSSPAISHTPLLTNKYSVQETSEVEIQTLPKAPTVSARKKHSLVESLTKRFTALSAASTPLKSEVPAGYTPFRSEVLAGSTPLRLEVLAGSTPLRSEVPAASTALRSEVPAASTALRSEVPAGSTPLRSEVPAGSTPLRSEVPAASTALRSEVPAGSTPLRSEILGASTALRSEVSVASTPLRSEVPSQLDKEDKSTDTKDTSRITGTFTATPVYIGKTNTCSPSFQVKRVFIYGDDVNSSRPSVAAAEAGAAFLNSDHTVCSKGRKRCPDVAASNSVVKKERRSSEISNTRPLFINSLVSRFVPVRKSSSTSTSKSEMSIESVDQAVCESDLKAIPAAAMEADSLRDLDGQAREVTRSNSCLSGKMEPQDSIPHPSSPTVHCSLVPRSHSDIGCCLESQHSRDSSLVSTHSRLSRASVGADLELFFNQMGLEKGVLEPGSRLRELQTSEVFDSISSLDSHDAASICSIYSRSEQEWSDPQSVERNQQQTSIVERNARIIKWLCNVKKAKGQQPPKLEVAAAGKI